jgi:hypothetical protein
MATAADVPGKYDVVINGQGYIFLDSIEPSLPFRTHRASYTFSPTFIDRQNVSGSFGDDQQDFWLTATQNDWSEGEDQKYFRSADTDSVRKFWKGLQVEATIPGEVTIGPSTKVVTTTSVGASCCWAATPGSFLVGSTTNLYEVSATGTVTDRGAHGAGAVVESVVSDGGVRAYLSGSTATKVRKYDTSAHTYADFSASPADVLAFLNNTLYGYKAGVLSRYDTSGTASTVATWKDATGVTLTGAALLCPFGGKLMILRTTLTATGGAELWVYDGLGVSKVEDFPSNFSASALCVSEGIIFIVGKSSKRGLGDRTVLRYWANGSSGTVWNSDHFTTATVGNSAVCPFSLGVLFTDGVDGTIRTFDLATGGVFTSAQYTPSTQTAQFAAGSNVAILTQNATLSTFLYNS